MDGKYRILGFEPGVVDRLLDFIYTGKYNPEDTETNGCRPSSQAASVRGKDPRINAVGKSLFLHLEMISIAEFYDVDQLRETATHSIRHILVDFWDTISPWYPAFIEAAFEKTNDVGLHTLVVDITSSHLDDLHGSVFGSGANLDVPAWFFSAVLEKSQKSVVGMKQVLLTADQMWQNLTHRLEDMLKERGY